MLNIKNHLQCSAGFLKYFNAFCMLFFGSIMKYSKQQIFLHWLSAVVIIWATLSGFYMAMFQPNPEIKQWVSFFNVSLTTVYIPFFFLRIWYAIAHGKPEETTLTAQEAKLAHWGHLALYINISVVLITGVLMMDRNINVFNVFFIPHPVANIELLMLFKQVHILSCLSLSLLIVGHVLAIVKHRFSGHNVLKRMLP